MKSQIKLYLVLATLLFLLTVLSSVLGLFNQRNADPLFQRPSSYFQDQGGTLVLFRLMKRFTPEVSRLHQPFSVISEENRPDTILVMAPAIPVGKKEFDALNQWVSDGGLLILATDKAWSIGQASQSIFAHDEEGEASQPGVLDHFGLSFVDDADAESEIKLNESFSRRLRGRSTRERDLEDTTVGRHTLALAGRLLQGGTSLNGNDDIGRLRVVTMGAGKVIAVGDPHVWSNRRLRFDDNELWLLETVAARGLGRVWIDEYHHGFAKKRHLLSLVFEFLVSPWGFAFIQLLLALVLLVLGPWRRFGSLLVPRREAVRDPMELVEARAQFLKAAAAHDFCFEMMHRYLLERLAHYGATTIAAQFNRALAGEPGLLCSDHWLQYFSLYKAFQDQKLTGPQLESAAWVAAAILEEYHHD